MQGTREQFDADRQDASRTYYGSPQGIYQYNLNCSICNQSLFVDKESYESAVRAVKEGLDNPFICDDCRDEYAELEHEQ